MTTMRWRAAAMVTVLCGPLLLSSCSGGTDGSQARSGTSGEAGASAAAPAIRMVRAEFDVEGMTCGGCELGVRTVLDRLDGVEKTEASYSDSKARVTFDPAKVDTGTMIAAIGELGYTATLVATEEAR